MSHNNLIMLLVVWGLSFAILIYGSFKHWRNTAASFLIMQLFTWPFGILAVEYGGLEYPVHFFPGASNTSFTYEFMAFPSMGVLFNFNFPRERSFVIKAVYLFAFTSCLTIVEVVVEHYTDLVQYLHWNWFASWITIAITLILNYTAYNWFISHKGRALKQL